MHKSLYTIEKTTDLMGFTEKRHTTITNMNKKITIALIFCFISYCMMAQSIDQLLSLDGNANDGFGEAVAINDNGDWAVIGTPRDSDIFSTAGSAYIFNRIGNDWTEHSKITANDAASLDNFGHAVAISGNGNFIVISSLFDDDNGDDSGSAYVFAKQGNDWIQQAKLTALNGATMDWFGQSIDIDQNGNTIIIGAYQTDNNGNNSGSSYIYTRNGSNWTEVIQLEGSDAIAEDQFGFDVSINDNGNRIAIGTFQTTGTGKAYVFDNNGGNWTETDILTPSDNPTDAWFGRSLALNGTGDQLIIGASADNNGQGAAYVFDNTGNWIETQKLQATDAANSDFFGNDVAIDNDKIFVSSYLNDTPFGNNSGSVYEFDNDGSNWIESNNYIPTTLADNDNFGEAIAISGDYLISGNKNDNDNGNLSGSAYIYDFSDLLFAQGGLFADLNDDCINNSNDVGIPNALITFNNGNEITYASTLIDGTYQIPVLPTGTYNVNPVLPSKYWENCSAPLSFDNTTGTQDIDLSDIILQPVVDCPFMNVGIASPGLERCYQSTYYVNYSNTGTVIANDAYIEITLDPFLTLDNSSIPFSNQDGNTYTFDIGDIDIFQSGSFTLDVTVSCDAALGQNHCTKADIFPNTYCFPGWNGSRIEVESECLANELLFRVRNIGLVNMLLPGKAQIIEDMIMRVNEDYLIDAGDEQIFDFDVIGGTVNFQTYQAVDYPYPDSLISITVEGCGATTPQMLGIFGEFPDNDENPYTSIDCQANTGSYDPNDKQAFPIGFEEDHLIQADYDLEYMIRFQNTGTNVAYQVIILDTLSEFLNPASIVIEAASHPYEFEIVDDNILKFTFNNILLPDSLSDPEGSKGFIKFIIEQTANNPIGTVINNDAAIYFDFNDPIITNHVFHTIGENYVMMDLIDDVNNLVNNVQVSVSPNPFIRQLHINILSQETTTSTFILTDALGKTIFQQENSGSSYTLSLPDLPTGTYFYQIISNSQPIKIGKLLTH
jgi:hypothetical protein